MVTIATNMAGRGTDIVLGGSMSKSRFPSSCEAETLSRCRQRGKADCAPRSSVANGRNLHEQVKAAKVGCASSATERHESPAH
jgi:preprotein translocase subunit SecA